MNLNPLPWLRGYTVRPELAKWTQSGIIQPDQAQRIDAQYDRSCCGMTASDAARVSLYGLSAVAMLLALVLVMADHWRGIYLPLKVGIALLSMVLAHAAGYWYRFHDPDNPRSDAAFLIGTILFGCVMLLAVDQYYAASPYRSMAFAWTLFAWSAGTLPLAWVLSSIALLALSCVLGAAWVVGLVLATGGAA